MVDERNLVYQRGSGNRGGKGPKWAGLQPPLSADTNDSEKLYVKSLLILPQTALFDSCCFFEWPCGGLSNWPLDVSLLGVSALRYSHSLSQHWIKRPLRFPAIFLWSVFSQRAGKAALFPTRSQRLKINATLRCYSAAHNQAAARSESHRLCAAVSHN